MMKVARISPISRRNPRQGPDLRSGTPDVTWRRALILIAEGGLRTPRPCCGAAAESADRPGATAGRAGNPLLPPAETPHALSETGPPDPDSPPARRSRSSISATRRVSLWSPRYRGAETEARRRVSAPWPTFATSHRGGGLWCRYPDKGRQSERCPEVVPEVAERPRR